MPARSYPRPPVIATRQDNHPRLGRGPITTAGLVRMLLEALVTVGTLVACTVSFGIRFEGSYVILALLVFSLTFPGTAPRATSPAGIARDVLTGWILIVVLLLLLGWATKTIGSFDERVMVMWVAI